MNRRRRRPLTENDDLLTEILLRLPPHSSSLPRAGLGCKRWRRLVTDPRFVRCFRASHRTPPLLGFFRSTCRFFRTLEPQNRLPASHFSLRRWRGRTCSLKWWLLDCRHGLLLYGFDGTLGTKEFVVVNPMTGHRRRVLNTKRDGVVAAAVVAAAGAGDDIFSHSFHLVVLFTPNYFEERVCASVYLSDSGTWAHSVATLVLPFPPFIIYNPCILSGNNAIYWWHDDGLIIQFDLETQRLAMMEQPPVAGATALTRQLATTDDGRFCFAVLSEFNIQLWEREEEESGTAATWVLLKTIQLDKVLDLKEPVKLLGITGLAEECNVIFCMHV